MNKLANKLQSGEHASTIDVRTVRGCVMMVETILAQLLLDR